MTKDKLDLIIMIYAPDLSAKERDKIVDACAQYHCKEAVDELKELRGVKVDGNDYADGINFGIDLSIQAITKRLKGDV